MLTDRQEKFAALVAAGRTQREAYRTAYPRARGWKDQIVDSAATRLAKNSKVCMRLAELRRRTATAARLTRERKLAMIEADIEKAVEQGDRYGMIALIRLHNDMTGDNAPERKEITVDVLSLIAERHKDVIREEE